MDATPFEESTHRGAQLLYWFSRCCEARRRGEDPTPFWDELRAVAREAGGAGDRRNAWAAEHILHTYGPDRPDSSRSAAPAPPHSGG